MLLFVYVVEEDFVFEVGYLCVVVGGGELDCD